MRLTSFVVEATIPTPVDIDGNDKEGQQSAATRWMRF
jgi:hypothetical protein